MVRSETIDFIKHIEREKIKFFEKRGLEKGLWRIELKIIELSNDFETPLNEIEIKEK